ncbi:MAG: hypothetical protein ABI766_11470, partial [Gemmatimonadales bacterium]
MNRLMSGLAALCSLLLVAGCNGDPTEPLRDKGINRIIAAPSQLFIELGATKSVDVGAVDSAGSGLAFDYQLTSVGSGITVKRDSSFRGEFLSDSVFTVPPTDLQFRFTVVATGYGATSFTVSAGGKDLVIPVQVVPQNQLGATFSTTTPALGETVTLTAPSGTSFAQTSTVSFGTATAFVVSVAADGSSLDFIPPPNLVDAQATITDVSSTATPDLTYTPTTTDGLTSPVLTTFPGTFSNIAPAVNEPVTLTLTGATFDPAATLLLGTGSPTVLSTTATTLTFLPAPGTTALLTVNGVILDALPQFSLSLSAQETDTLRVDTVIPTMAGTDAAGTAPRFAIPASGNSVAFYDAPPFGAAACGGNTGFPCALYKITLSADAVLDATLTWDNAADMGLY